MNLNIEIHEDNKFSNLSGNITHNSFLKDFFKILSLPIGEITPFSILLLLVITQHQFSGSPEITIESIRFC